MKMPFLNRPLAALMLASCTAFLPPTAIAQAGEHEVTLQVDGTELHATLRVPDGGTRPPVALILAGSGPTDRDGNSAAGLHTDMYKKLSVALNAAGIASLRPDKRGVGLSKTTQAEASLTFTTLTDDATAWIRWLNDPHNGLGKVAVIGHSEGALVGLVAALNTPVTAYVSLAGAGENIADTLTRQVHSNPNNPPALVQEADQAIAALRMGHLVPQVSPALQALFRPSVQPYLISWMQLDPPALLAGFHHPALIVQGDRDVQVTVEDARKLSAAQPNAQLSVIPGMNHLLVDASADPAGNLATYTQPQVPLNAQFIQTLTTFLGSAFR